MKLRPDFIAGPPVARLFFFNPEKYTLEDNVGLYPEGGPLVQSQYDAIIF